MNRREFMGASLAVPLMLKSIPEAYDPQKEIPQHILDLDPSEEKILWVRIEFGKNSIECYRNDRDLLRNLIKKKMEDATETVLLLVEDHFFNE